MTSTPVTDAKSLFADFAAKTSASRYGTDAAGSFSNVLSKRTGENVQNQQPHEMSKDGLKAVQAKVSKSAARKAEQEDVVTKPEQQENDDTQESLVNVLQQIGQAAVEEIAKELGISEEEVLEAMEALGMTALDLLQPDNLTMVVMEVTKETDPMAILTNEDLYLAVKNLNEFVQNALNEAEAERNLSEGELSNLLKEMKQNMDMPVEGISEETAEIEQKPEITVEVVSEGKETGREAEQPKGIMDADAEQTEVKVPAAGADQSANAGKEEGQKSGSDATQQNLVLQNLNNQEIRPFEQEAAGRAADYQATTTEIMDQILDTIKIQVKPDMSQIEMQLHPESLGTVNVHISAKEGMITAQFTAQNEAVKAALETQMVQLRESFNEQGIKVEAIEVNIQSNAYQQEYESSSDQRGYSEEDKKKAPRRINLDNPAFFENEELSDEEQLAVSMMEANGNTVDYTA